MARTVAHMLSGMPSGGGIAYIGVLCGWYGSRGGNYAYGERHGFMGLEREPCKGEHAALATAAPFHHDRSAHHLVTRSA